MDRNSKAAFVKNFKNNYESEKVPIYALIEVFSFGTLSKFYKNVKREDKRAITIWRFSIGIYSSPTGYNDKVFGTRG